jgi:galactose mutarotase-like enzyme
VFIPPDRRSIALEPVTAATNSFNMPELGRMVLAPGQLVSGTISVGLVAQEQMHADTGNSRRP